jgi:iron(III) transport system ATP-binding protein
MGMVFQSYAIWPHMTVFENVAYPLRVRRLPKSDIVTKVRNVLQLVGLSGFEERPATRLSGGQMQRIAVARALVFGPDILLMDEPFSNLDAKLREQMRTEVKLLQRQLGITVVFVTHDQSEALGLSDRIAVMNRGRMEQVGPPQALYADPLTPAVRDFLGRTIVLAGTLIDRGLNGALVELRDGTRIQLTGGERGERLEIGESCAVSIRPEFIAVTPAAAPRAKTGVLQPNVIAGQLRALLFLGDRYEASVTSKTAGDLTVILPATGNWAEGQEVAISLPPERLQLWPA